MQDEKTNLQKHRPVSERNIAYGSMESDMSWLIISVLYIKTAREKWNL